jgi:hypothetical protein
MDFILVGTFVCPSGLMLVMRAFVDHVFFIPVIVLMHFRFPLSHKCPTRSIALVLL